MPRDSRMFADVSSLLASMSFVAVCVKARRGVYKYMWVDAVVNMNFEVMKEYYAQNKILYVCMYVCMYVSMYVCMYVEGNVQGCCLLLLMTVCWNW
jgi:hypothetical protein